MYKEAFDQGNEYRKKYLYSLELFLKKEQEKAIHKRSKYFVPNFENLKKYAESLEEYRDHLKNMLGYPLNINERCEAKVEYEFVAKDELCHIFRLWIETGLENLSYYAMLFVPNSLDGKAPLVVSQHGGMGTPEKPYGIYDDTSNYNYMTKRIVEKGIIVFSPQLLLWSNEIYGNPFDRKKIDSDFKQIGSSITAVEIFSIMSGIDVLSKRDDVDHNRIGMVGLSYGGFYTLFTTAIDTRIKVALSSCFFNNRIIYNWMDWIWFDSANTLTDDEIVALICPRPLCIEVGKTDELFDISNVKFNKINDYYKKLQIEEKLLINKFDGGHEFNKSNIGLDFFIDYL